MIERSVSAVERARMDVVVVCWNDRDKIATALDSIFALPEISAQPDSVRVVVSDNGSTDGSCEFLRARYGKQIHIVENGKNLGFAGACNRAFAATSAEYIFLLNPDAELRPGALAVMIAFLDVHPRCGIAGSRILNYDGSVQQSVGEFDTWAGAFLRSSAWGEWPMFARYANGASLRDWRHDTERRVDLAIGAALAIRRSLIAQIGAFDERYFLYHEEVDFAKRAADAGWETWFVPASEAVHEGQGSAKGQYSVEERKQRSRRKYWIKHHGRWWLYALNAALVGRYVLYLAVAAGAVVIVRRALRR